MFIQTTGVEIDVENSLTYGTIYTTAGRYSGVNVKGQLPSMILNYKCDPVIPMQTVNLYVDLNSQTINTYIGGSCIEGVHLGGAIVTGDGCNCNVFAFLKREDDCLIYKRAFSPAFSSAYSYLDETINICKSDNKEYSDDFHKGININEKCSDTTLYDGNTCIYSGNNVLINGNID